MLFQARQAIFVLILCLLPGTPMAYVTSANLEYCSDDVVAFYLNGSVLLERSDFQPFNYDILSTADGTLPLELFKENEDNLLATENFDTEAGQMGVSFRLTVYHSDGDPVVIWSVPEQNKFIHLEKEQKSPAGWFLPSFDDSKWGQSLGVNLPGPWTEMTILEDSAFEGIIGVGKVPYLVHRADARCRGGDHNLFRAHFRFPNHPAKVEIQITPPKAVVGQNITVRLIPGPDTTEISQFNMMAWLPKNVQIVGASEGARYDDKLRRVHWVQSNRDMAVTYLKLHAAKVLAAGGWGAPEKMLGPPKRLPRRAINTPASQLNNGTLPTQGLEGWFKMDAPKVDFTRGMPKIQGVIFHSQYRPGSGARNYDGKKEVDKMMFNYSVNGKMERALKSDVNVIHTAWDAHWVDNYYDASEDRDWTWEDIKNLMVVFEAKQVATRDRNLMASVTCVIRYYYPDLVKPTLYAKVIEKRCADIELKTGIFRYGAKAVISDPFVIKANEHLCQPSPVPTKTWTPIPIVEAKPLPTSTPAPPEHVNQFANIGLDCLGTLPSPVDYAGAFITFCLKIPADITVNIYSGSGKGVRRISAGEHRASEQNTVFFNARDDKGKLLPAGRYLLEIVAKVGNQVETRNNPFSVVKKKQK